MLIDINNKTENFFIQLIEHHLDTLNDDEHEFYFTMEGIILSILLNHYFRVRVESRIRLKILYERGL